MLVLGKFDYVYSDQQKDALRNAITNNIEVGDIKNPGIPLNLMETYIELRSYGYDIEFLEDHGIGLLSITYLDCLKELARNDIDIYQFIYCDKFIPYDNRQILTITDGLLEGFDIRYFGNINLSNTEMREIIETLKKERIA
jgi:hypothetical protein